MFLADGTQSQKQTGRAMIYIMRILLAIALLLTTTILPAQNQTSADHGKDELRFTLVLSRHGRRFGS